jgi:hypothetical protein
MSSTLRISMLAAAILGTPLLAFAQSNNPTGNMGSNSSATATPPNADSHAASGMNTGDANATAKKPTMTDKSTTVPGATGRTVVPGSTSTVSGDHAGTAATKTGQTGTGSGK